MKEQLIERKQYLLEGGYAREEEISFGQCDCNLNVHVSTVLKQFVSTASRHCQAYGLTQEVLLREDKAFLITRLRLEIYKMSRCFDFLTITTWLDGVKGPYYQRVVEWKDREGNVVISGRSDWVLVKPSNRTIYRPDKKEEFFSTTCPVEIECAPCSKIDIKGMDFVELGTHCVKWSELDGNGHLHSGNYGDIIWNFLPNSFQQKVPSVLEVEFKKEACLDDVISIQGYQKEDGAYVMVGKGVEVVHFTALIE